MKPTLAAVSGPLKGKKIFITEPEWTIGRGEGNQLYLHDRSASRGHCMIKTLGDEFKLVDLESKNGTFVENIPIKSHELKHGETIRIGDSVFIFLLEKDETGPQSNAVEIESENVQSQTTISLRRSESIYLNREKLQSLLPAGRLAQDLNILLTFSKEIISTQDQGTLFRRAMQLIFEAMPVQQGTILLKQPGSEELNAAYSFDSVDKENASTSVNDAIVQKVLKENSAMLFNDILESDVKSILCSTIQSLTNVFGVIYLTTRDPFRSFDENHLQLITAMSAMLAIANQNLMQTEQLENENRRLREEIHIQHQMVGESPVMKELYRSIEKVAATDCTVLIYGETGTGKELVARAIHKNSDRSEKPFVAINCAALTETLLESELFGHEKGAFTGAIAQKKGKIELADSGTLFLDEVAELTPPLQAKLLRVLQEREFERVGGTRSIHVDVRLIAATNKDLKEAVTNGKFRDDLYFRLNVVSLTTPLLKDRAVDIPLLANYFTSKYSAQFKRRVTGISTEAKMLLGRYRWPGNVRELENAIERAIVMGSSDILLPEDLPEAILESATAEGVNVGSYQDAILEAKRAVIVKAVAQAKGNYAEAAKILGVQRTYLHRVMRNLNLKPDKG
ncbi:MAG TPA: sigma 54-interacting transcriptional regulator [Acidobacteriota bacterium]|nr:sigma 54-interacting transcriptional regulator [Acidobacteriota bacterium]